MTRKVLGLVPFEIVNEPWNEYKIKDQEDVLLRGRLMLTKVMRIQDAEKPERKGISLGSTPIWVTNSPESLRDKPSEHLPPINEIPEHLKKEMKVEMIKEDWNSYRITEDKVELRLRQIISHVFKVKGLFSSDGEPYFVVEGAALFELSGENSGLSVAVPEQ